MSEAGRVFRILVYAFIVSWLTARITYVTTYARPDRPFTFDHVLTVFAVGALACLAIAVTESAYLIKSKFIWIHITFSICFILALATFIDGLMWSDDRVTCNATFLHVVLAPTTLDADIVMREFGPMDVFRTIHVDTTANLTAFGVRKSFNGNHKDIVEHTLSTYALLEKYETHDADWIVVFEAGAKSLPKFQERLQSWVCRHRMQDLIWLQAPAILRWSISGGIVDGTTTMVYKRTSIPKILEWMHFDGKGADIGLRDHDEDSYEIAAINHILSDACYEKEIECGVVPLVVEQRKRDH